MTVPQPRLLLFVAIAGLPLALLAAARPGAAPTAALALLASAVAADAALAPRRLAGIEVALPATLRFLRDRAGTVEILVRNPSGRARDIALGVALPAVLGGPDDPLLLRLPEGETDVRAALALRPRRRGAFRIARAHIETISPFGFWGTRRSIPLATEVRVYPNLLAEGAAALFLRRGQTGAHPRRRVGKGREFESLRDYIPGDGYEDLHWKATAKRGRPVTKVFQIERTQEVYAVVDASRLAARHQGEPPAQAIERFIAAALLLARAAERQGDLFGLVAYRDTVVRFLRAGRGSAHFGACREALCALEARTVPPDFEEIATWISNRVRRRALLLYLTDLDDPVLAAGFLRGVDLLARRHLVLACLIRPAGARPLFSGPDVAAIDDVYDRLAGHLAWQEHQELARAMQRRGAAMRLMDSAVLPTGAVGSYLDAKRRQAL